ncbi:MAG: CoA pyrophosphatase [Anaerolineales bacterium]
MNADQLTAHQIQTVLKSQPFKPLHDLYPQELLKGDPRPAAVLIPLVQAQDSWHVLLIRRTHIDGDIHSGQVAFPGGGLEKTDSSLIETALRETNEELGIQPEDVQILGRLNEFISISNYRVTPYIGTLPWPYPIVQAEKEVARWFTIPLRWLADENNRTIQRRTLPKGLGEIGVIFFNDYDGEVLWGLSARIITEFLDVAGLNGSKE